MYCSKITPNSIELKDYMSNSLNKNICDRHAGQEKTTNSIAAQPCYLRYQV